MSDRHPITEEPDEGKLSCPVLETSRRGDPAAEFDPNSKWRAAVVQQAAEVEAETSEPRPRGRHWISWSNLLRRVFEIDVLVCPECGGRCRILSVIEAEHQGEVVERILAALRGRSPPGSV